jgi:predicted SAM-dependent methyltransferase
MILYLRRDSCRMGNTALGPVICCCSTKDPQQGLPMSRAREYLKAHTTKALRLAVRQFELEWLMFRRHRRALKKAFRFRQGSELKLNLGCGPNAKSGWLNIDLFDPGADLQLDLRERWPFQDLSVSHIYSEHVFEHFEFHDEVPSFLSESLRVLQLGGIFDIGVPDSDWPIHAYGNPNDSYWHFAKTVHPPWCETQLDHINDHFRQERPHKYRWESEHKYAWDEQTLARSLKRSGFRSIVRRQFDPTLDSEFRRTGTLYMRAIKT